MVNGMFRKLVWFAVLYTFVVVVVGAYVRLSDAGLGCPDWPGCYGRITPHHAQDAIAGAVEQQGGEHGPVSLVTAWWRRCELGQSPWLASSVVGVVVLQAALGMWTVTLLLKPVIVTLHLLGGLTTLVLLAWLALRQQAPRTFSASALKLRTWALLALCTDVVQIALGGWVSTNYAPLACTDFPTCHGEWMPEMDFRHGFQLIRELGMTASGAYLSQEALTAIHWTHRVGALVTAVVVGSLAWALWRVADTSRYGVVLAAAV